jgi:hypothetical protein
MNVLDLGIADLIPWASRIFSLRIDLGQKFNGHELLTSHPEGMWD